MQENSRANHKNLVGNDENKFLFEKSVRRYINDFLSGSILIISSNNIFIIANEKFWFGYGKMFYK